MCQALRLQAYTAVVLRNVFIAAVLLVASVATGTAQTTVTVDATKIIRVIPSHFVGINTAIWDDQFSSPATADLLRAANVRMLRFPGGTASDEYHWAVNRSEGSSFPWPTDFNTFARTATDLGIDAMITVNYGTGTAEEAASWVQYANVNSGRAFKFWEIGNEVYGSWETDKHTRPHDPRTYAEEAAAFIDAMKKVDPTIRIGIPVVPGEDDFANYDDELTNNPRTGVEHKGWTPLVLTRMRELNTLPDFVSYHRYEFEPFNEDDATLLAAPAAWSSTIARLRQILDDYLGPNTIQIFATENNSVTSRPGKQTTNLVNALYLADSYAQALRTELESVIWWDLRNGALFNNNNSEALYGRRTYGDYGVLSTMNERYPTAYALEMFGNFARAGDTLINATSTSTLVTAYATRRAGGSIAVLVINKDRDRAQDVVMHFSGFTPAASAMTLLTYGKPNDNANSDITRTTTSTTTIHAEPYSMNLIIVNAGAARRRAVHR